MKYKVLKEIKIGNTIVKPGSIININEAISDTGVEYKKFKKLTDVQKLKQLNIKYFGKERITKQDVNNNQLSVKEITTDATMRHYTLITEYNKWMYIEINIISSYDIFSNDFDDYFESTMKYLYGIDYKNKISNFNPNLDLTNEDNIIYKYMIQILSDYYNDGDRVGMPLSVLRYILDNKWQLIVSELSDKVLKLQQQKYSPSINSTDTTLIYNTSQYYINDEQDIHDLLNNTSYLNDFTEFIFDCLQYKNREELHNESSPITFKLSHILESITNQTILNITKLNTGRYPINVYYAAAWFITGISPQVSQSITIQEHRDIFIKYLKNMKINIKNLLSDEENIVIDTILNLLFIFNKFHKININNIEYATNKTILYSGILNALYKPVAVMFMTELFNQLEDSAEYEELMRFVYKRSLK